MSKIAVINTIPPQTINELASYGPFDLNAFIKTVEGGVPIKFSAGLKSGGPLPKGLILTANGMLTGIPAKDTQGLYEVVVTAESEQDVLKETFLLTIKPSFTTKETEYLDKLKSQVWQALDQQLPIPEITELLTLPITQLDVYYLLERWGTLTVWDAFNLDPPSEKILLNIEGVSPHYNVYDRGSSLIMAPKDLFSYERTTRDGIETAKAMAKEVYQRGWTIEMAGYEKWMHSAWIELQLLGDRMGKQLEIINYQPSKSELRTYEVKSWIAGTFGPEA